MNVTVIIPTYNRSALLCQAIESVLAQSYRDLEIIVVDDGSTDDTEHAVQRYGQDVRFIQQSHKGPNAARNRALDASNGAYIALLDDDDLWHKQKLELQVAILDLFPDVAYTFSDFHILKETGEMRGGGLSTWHPAKRPPGDIYGSKIKASTLPLPRSLTAQDYDLYIGNIYRELLFQPHVLPSSALVRREHITPDIRFVDEDFHCGDWEFFARLSRQYRSAFIDHETTINRSHADAVRLTKKSQKVQSLCRLNMTRRVWRSDSMFYKDHAGEVDRVEGAQLIKIAKLHILDSERKEASDALKARAVLSTGGDRGKVIVLSVLAKIPLAGWLLSLALAVKNILTRIAFPKAGAAAGRNAAA